MNFNKVLLGGRLTRDPQLRKLASGTSIVEFGLAVNEVYYVGEEKRERVLFTDVQCWGSLGEVIHKHLTKGREIFVEGSLRFEQWEKDGEKRQKTYVTVETFQFVGPPPQQQEGGGR